MNPGLCGTIWIADDLTCFWTYLNCVLHEGSYEINNFSSIEQHNAALYRSAMDLGEKCWIQSAIFPQCQDFVHDEQMLYD